MAPSPSSSCWCRRFGHAGRAGRQRDRGRAASAPTSPPASPVPGCRAVSSLLRGRRLRRARRRSTWYASGVCRRPTRTRPAACARAGGATVRSDPDVRHSGRLTPDGAARLRRPQRRGRGRTRPVEIVNCAVTGGVMAARVHIPGGQGAGHPDHGKVIHYGAMPIRRSIAISSLPLSPYFRVARRNSASEGTRIRSFQ